MTMGERSFDLSQHVDRKALANRIAEDIDAYCLKHLDDGHRNHLGISGIGEPCARRIQYQFRWIKREQHNARMLRLFKRGHFEEARFISYLEGIGFRVGYLDADGKQFRVASHNGHFGGSTDGIGEAPPHYNISERFLLEFKTRGTGRGFVNLREKGVAVDQPKHFAQMSSYGRALGLKYAIYMAVNKNDDDLYIEVVELNWKLADELWQKAGEIIEARSPLPRIAENPAFVNCKYCHFSDICHGNEQPEKNCRSCVNSQPVGNSEWYCRIWSAVIPQEFIAKGCDNWSSFHR